MFAHLDLSHHQSFHNFFGLESCLRLFLRNLKQQKAAVVALLCSVLIVTVTLPDLPPAAAVLSPHTVTIAPLLIGATLCTGATLVVTTANYSYI